jgi:DNA polymerase-3 subunit epsilon
MLELSPRRAFVALDFETADHGRDSACAVGVIRVRDGEVVERFVRYIRPPRRPAGEQFTFTWVHGITWGKVADAPTFGELWPSLAPMFDGAAFIAAHNAPFDRGVLLACCERFGLAPPTLPFVDTVRVARKVWQLRPARLPDVCRHLGLTLQHHDAGSDAEACARIVVAAGADR